MRSRTTLALATALLAGCFYEAKVVTPSDAGGAGEAGHTACPSPPGASVPTNKLDLLVMVDNSNSMKDNQANIMAQLGPFIRTLVTPPCVSATNPAPHACDASDPADHVMYAAAQDLHIGVVSSDLGTPGSTVPGCVPGGALGDNGVLNPIHFGDAMQQHEPTPGPSPSWPYGSATSAPAGFLPDDFTDPTQFPSFLTYTAGMSDPEVLVHDFRCNAGLYINGCGLEQQLEAVQRALIGTDATACSAGTSPTPGFLRDDALLAIVMLTDEEDGSVRPDAQDVFDSASTNWSSADLNLRMYLAQPGGAQDPTWPLERYVDPRDPSAGWMRLKPGHPERIVFAAITGVPLDVPADHAPDWNSLLGTPGPNGPDDFNGRDSSTAITTTTPDGLISMRHANMDPNCNTRVVPACRRHATMPPVSDSGEYCQTAEQYFAWPSRRIVEIARRFDEAPMCNGQPCHNGIVASVCSDDYSNVMQFVASTCLRRMAGM